jgi:hypothetical protein
MIWRAVAARSDIGHGQKLHGQKLQGRGSRELEFGGRPVRGRILRVRRKDVNFKGYVHHADADDPQYEIKSDRTDHVALHKGRALRLLSH